MNVLCPPKIILFDWHGTLVDTNDAMYLALYLFKGGPAPLSPYPQPGRDSLVPERDQIDCGD